MHVLELRCFERRVESGPEVWQGLVHTIPIGCDAGRSGLCTPGGEGEDKGETFGKRKCPKLPPLGASPSEHRGCARLQPHNACRTAPNRCQCMCARPWCTSRALFCVPRTRAGRSSAYSPSIQTKGLPDTACMQEAQPSCFRHGGSMLGIDSPESSRVGVLSCQ